MENNNFSGKIRECVGTLYEGLAHTAPPTNTNFRLMCLLTQLLEAFYEDLLVYHHFSGLSFISEVNFWHPLKTVIYCDFFIIISEFGNTLYVGLTHTAPPANTNFRLTFLFFTPPTSGGSLYGDMPVWSIKFEVYYHFSSLSFIAEVNFWLP